MKLSSLLDRRFMVTGAELSSKEEAIRALVQLICSHTELRRRSEAVLATVMQREQLGGTTFPTEIAIPHGRIPDFDDMWIGVCLPREPVMSEGVALRMIVLILTSTTPSNLYLNTLAALARVSKNRSLFKRLASSESYREFSELLEKENIEVKHTFTVADVMSTELTTLTPGTSLREVVDLFYQRRLSYAPVVDAGGRFAAEVSLSDLLRMGIPDFAERMPNLKFVSDFAPLENLLAREEELRVSDVMQKAEIALDPGDSIAQAAFELTRHRRQHLSVVKGDRVVGIVSSMDLLDKVLRR